MKSLPNVSNVITDVGVDNTHTKRQTDKQTNKQTNKQTVRKQFAPIIRSGGRGDKNKTKKLNKSRFLITDITTRYLYSIRKPAKSKGNQRATVLPGFRVWEKIILLLNENI